ncbi:MAG: type II secretion system F family protein [Actinomycetota bacterium]|nr:type II secretion system F family protein [Actinomycetota bacterium]
MSVLVPVLAGLGLAALVAGVPLFHKARLAERVEPYLGGLHGRPSALVPHGGTSPYPRIAAWVARLAPGGDELGRRLAAAGDDRGPDGFRVEQTAWALAGLAASLAVVVAGAAAGVSLAPASVPALALVSSAAGWLGRDWWLSRQIEHRRATLREELPPAIDLLVLAIMAGESVPAAFARISDVLRGPLAREIGIVLADIRSGAPVVEALEGLTRRVPDPAVARFVDALCTGIEKGAPLADVLRAQADDGRDQRRRYLLELGGRREVWMLVPVVFLIMPVVVVWALFPGLVSLDLLVP